MLYIGAKYLLQERVVKMGGGLIVELGVLTRHYGTCIFKDEHVC